MVYMVGDAGLDYNGFTDLKEMKAAGSTDELALVAQFCRGVKNRPTKRYYLTRDTRDGTLTNDVIEDLTETQPASPEALAGFLNWGIDTFPARYYMAVLWGHGNGANDENMPYPIILPTENHQHDESVQTGARSSYFPQSRAIVIGPSAAALDPYSLDCLDSRNFQKALKLVHAKLERKLDILGMDSCVMSGAEVCYQLRDYVRFTVAPEGMGPADGWPYDRILSALRECPTMTPTELAGTIAEKFVASYADCDGLSVTQAVCDLEKSNLLAHVIDKLAEVLIVKLKDRNLKHAMMLSRWQVQAYENTEYVDLYDFCELLRDHSDDLEVHVACEQVMQVIANEFVVKSHYQGEAVQYSYGLSIYFPLHEVSQSYERLDIAHDTSWVQFLKAYVSEVRRPNRKNSENGH
jgi:hypothetical protein